MSTQVDITFDQNSVFSLVVFRARDERNQVIDLSGKFASCAFKINYTSNVAFTLSANTNQNGEITIFGDLISTNVAPGRYVYDIVLSDGNRIVSGLATVKPAISPIINP